MKLNRKIREKILLKILEKADPNYFHREHEINFRCPFCGDSQKFANKRRGWYNLRSDMFHCFNCCYGTKGAFSKLLEAYGVKADINLAAQAWKNEDLFEAEEEQEQNIPEKIKITYNSFLKKCILISESCLAPKEAINKWKERNLDRTDYPFYYCGDNSRFHNRIIIPFFDEIGDCIYFQARALDRGTIKYLNPKGDKDAVFGINNIDRLLPVVVVEGPIDSLFVENSVAVMTKSIKTSQLVALKGVNLTIMFDNDRDGRKASLKYAKDYKIFFYPDEFLPGEDINDYCVRKGITKLSLDFVISNCLIKFQAEVKLKLLLKL